MTTRTQPKELSRLQKLTKLEEKIRLEQLGEEDFEYRDHLECLRLRVLAEMKLEHGKQYVKPAIKN